MSAACLTYGDYGILDTLGVGGMGVVYRARHGHTGQVVAVKTVARRSGVAVEALYREVQALSRLSHPGIVRILDHGMAEGVPWYAMELLQGRTLQDCFAGWRGEIAGGHGARTVPYGECLSQDPEPCEHPSSAPRREPRREMLRTVRRLCDPLSTLHSAGLVHGDLNPSNIFVRDDGQPVLFDFGLASRFRREDGRAPLEAAGQLRGTFDYMAPEQVQGAALDARADLYALGCTLFEGLTGQRLFPDASGIDVLRRHLSEPPRRPSSLVPGLEESLDVLVMGLLAKNPAQRTGYADDVALALDALDVDSERASDPARLTLQPYVYRPAFQGRSTQMEKLGVMLEQLAAGRGGVALIVGESGAGKTSLMSELATRARQLGLRAAMGECRDVGRGESRVVAPPLHPLRPLLRMIASDCMQDELRHASVLGDREGTLGHYEPALRATGKSVAHEARATGEGARDRVLRDLRLTVQAYARGNPTLLCVDDLQWADALTLRWLATNAADYFTRCGILLVATVRSAELPSAIASWSSSEEVSHFDVGPLEPQAVEAMVRDMLGLPTLPAPLVGFLHRNGQGNPFFIGEYVHAAVAEGILSRGKGGWDLQSEGPSRLGSLTTPESVRDLVLRRFRRQDASARAVGLAAAVLGRRCTPAHLWFTAGVSEAEGVRALQALSRTHILQMDSDDTVHFIHDRVRESLYSDLPADERRVLHERAAAHMEAALEAAASKRLIYPELAHHLRASGQTDRASHYFELAGFSALRGAATRDARTHLEQALHLAIDPPPARAARLHRGLAEASLGLGELSTMTSHLHAALRRAGADLPVTEPARTRFIVSGAARQLLRYVRPGAGVARDAAARELSREVSMALQLLSIRYIFDDDAPNLIMASLWAANHGEAAGGGLSMATPYASLGYVARLARLNALADRYFRMAASSARLARDLDDHANARNNEAAAALGAGEWEAAESAVDHAMQLAKLARNPQQDEIARTVRFYVDFLQGHPDRALGWLPQMLESAGARGNAQREGWALVMRGTVAQERGELASALCDLELARAKLLSASDHATETLCVGLLAGVKARLGEMDEALSLSGQSVQRVADKFPVVFSVAKGLEGAALAPLLAWQRALESGGELGDLPRRARAACGQYMRYGRIFPVGAPGAFVMRAWADWLAGDRLRARLHARSALRLAERVGIPFAAACAHAQLAAWGPFRAQHSRRAQSVFAELGAQPAFVCSPP